MNTIYKVLFLMASLFVGTLNLSAQFVTCHDGKLWRDGKPYYYVDTNLWYGAILGSEGQGGDRARLCRELDDLNRNGIDNLRILVGSDGRRGIKTKVEPTLQEAPGVYNDTVLAGLDYLLQQMGKRKMVAVLYLNNSWEWSGGYGYYLEQAGRDVAPIPRIDGYPNYMHFVEQYATCEKAHQLFYDYVCFILGRTNRYTGKRYIDDPAIMSWQIGNEPRACANTKDYISRHLDICQRIGKPLVMEEFGYPRDNMSFKRGSPTTARDGFYRYVFNIVTDNAKEQGLFAGCNFWG